MCSVLLTDFLNESCYLFLHYSTSRCTYLSQVYVALVWTPFLRRNRLLEFHCEVFLSLLAVHIVCVHGLLSGFSWPWQITRGRWGVSYGVSFNFAFAWDTWLRGCTGAYNEISQTCTNCKSLSCCSIDYLHSFSAHLPFCHHRVAVYGWHLLSDWWGTTLVEVGNPPGEQP